MAEIARKFDSVMFCLSKGLCAPVGSMLVGSKAFIEKARVFRKAMGGGMRQAGVLAAAGLIALEKMPARLQEDHDNARLLAEGLAEIKGIKIDAKKVRTNVLVFSIVGTGMDTAEFSRKLGEKKVLAAGIDHEQMRFVTHNDVSREDCGKVLEAVKGNLQEVMKLLHHPLRLAASIRGWRNHHVRCNGSAGNPARRSQTICLIREKTARVIGRSQERLQPLVDRGAEASSPM